MVKRNRPRCAACKGRIKPSEANYGVERLDGSGKERLYHVDADCARHAFSSMLRGEATIIHHYHVCGDETNGFSCDCFSYDAGELAGLSSH